VLEHDKFREAVVLQEIEVSRAFDWPRLLLPDALTGAPLLVEPPLTATPNDMPSGSEVLVTVGVTADSKLAKAEHNLARSKSSSSAFAGICDGMVIPGDSGFSPVFCMMGITGIFGDGRHCGDSKAFITFTLALGDESF
jgi:hypothetical protein